MAEKLDMEVEKEDPKIELEGEGMPKRVHHSEEYFRGYKSGWEAAKKNLLRKLSQSGGSIEQKSTKEKPIGKRSKKEDGETIFWVAILGAVVLGGILFVFFSERNRERSQPS